MSEINPERQDGKKQRIRYSEEYQMNAAKMVLIDGFSTGRAAASLGCTHESIRTWVRKYRSRFWVNQLRCRLVGGVVVSVGTLGADLRIFATR